MFDESRRSASLPTRCSITTCQGRDGFNPLRRWSRPEERAGGGGGGVTSTPMQNEKHGRKHRKHKRRNETVKNRETSRAPLGRPVPYDGIFRASAASSKIFLCSTFAGLSWNHACAEGGQAYRWKRGSTSGNFSFKHVISVHVVFVACVTCVACVSGVLCCAQCLVRVVFVRHD